MAKYFYRISLVHVEPANSSKFFVRDFALVKFETDSLKDAQSEVRRLQSMVDRPSWQLPTRITIERAEIGDWESITLDQLERGPIESPHRQVEAAAQNVASDEVLPDHLQNFIKDRIKTE